MSKLPSDVAIRVTDVHKDFYFSRNNDDSIKHRVITSLRKKDNTKEYNHSLRGVSFDIKKGEFFGIVGRNGAGKSTLLKIISEIYQPTTGTVQHNGKLVAFIELGVGFNPQLTGRDNVYLNAAMLGFSRQETDEMYDEIVRFAELEKFMDLDLKNYSSGMKVRLAFSVAIRAQADILILDEVLAVGDADFQRKCYEYFKNLKEAHKTIVLVSHSMNLIKQYCDKAILINEGKIAFEGSAEDAADEYTKLFNKPKDKKILDSSQRWGSGEVRIDRVDTSIDKDKLCIEIDVKRVNESITDIVLPINIYNETNTLVTGVLAKTQRENILKFTHNNTEKLRYEFSNIFGGGRYYVTLSLKSVDGSCEYDFWKNATTFMNDFEKDKYFPTIYPVKVTRLH